MVADMSPAAPPDGSYLLCSGSGTGGVGLGGMEASRQMKPALSSLCLQAEGGARSSGT